jgi:hypothetical protein
MAALSNFIFIMFFSIKKTAQWPFFKRQTEKQFPQEQTKCKKRLKF